jgi:molybdenum cofactor biosynthesis protein B
VDFRPTFVSVLGTRDATDSYGSIGYGRQRESGPAAVPALMSPPPERRDMSDSDAGNGGQRAHDEENHGHEHGEAGTHDHHGHDVETLHVAVVTVSSSRSLDHDEAGDAIAAAVEDDGHEVAVRNLVADDYDGVQDEIRRLIRRDDVDAVVTTGGTGVTPDDVTVEAAGALFDKELPGFGELFRRLSYDEVGTRIVGTRAVAGVASDVPVFCLPGSENAARLGAEEIIVPEMGHLAGLARRGGDEDEEN